MDTLAQLRAGRLAGATRLDLSCGLTAFPREIFELADSLEVLNLTGNALTDLPDDLHRLHRLRVLFCSDNRFIELPAVLGRCTGLDTVGFKANRIRSVPAAALPPSLRWLILTDNDIDELPASIGQCTRLQKLMLAGNRLQALPDALANCRRLELVRLAANRFDALPDVLTSLPRLAWLAMAGNPWNAEREDGAIAALGAQTIDIAQLQLAQVVGEGASGVIHRAQWQDSAGAAPTPVAVKLFKGAVTSDGWPRSEMAACLAAGTQANLIAVRGRLTGHPQGIEGLVLEWVDTGRFANLAGPPSLASCTRDVYADDARWPLARAHRLAQGVAAAAQHLHARGIAHGDLYAHNILWNAEGDGLLGDFGAATLLPADPVARLALQRIEVRAFGCLLEELLAHSDDKADSSHIDNIDSQADARTALARLRDQCLQPVAVARPLFDAITLALADIDVGHTAP